MATVSLTSDDDALHVKFTGVSNNVIRTNQPQGATT